MTSRRNPHVPGVSWRPQPARAATRRPGPTRTAGAALQPALGRGDGFGSIARRGAVDRGHRVAGLGALGPGEPGEADDGEDDGDPEVEALAEDVVGRVDAEAL